MIDRLPSKNLFHPRYWFSWFLVLIAKLFVFIMPYRLMLALGRLLARMVYPFLKRRKHIALINLRLCFPEKNEKEIEALCKASFESLGMSAVETLMAWFLPNWRFRRIPFKLANFEQFEQAYAQKKPVIVMGGHFTCMEMVGRYVGMRYPGLNLVYQKHKNPFFEYLMTSSRGRYSKGIERKDVRGILRVLKKGEVLWYAPDQDLGNERTIFVPFFNIPCATLVATSWLVKKSNALMAMGHFRREKDYSGYVGVLDEYDESFSSGDDYKDALRYNQHLERVIRKYPDQYLWQHRRFKTRPEGEEGFY
ncbi:LpxL/LpxP family Kdo(2)-lipid IV(A) lauroyl/palmitoleoyl acyltransferase [Thiotrichales bacterium 19S9-12]|nr:LpxL/LpxP family Kdo(2)-lipid IV(A) lauroyl/palmitoleoyl acyltransferase [Thiotrichales bacterium 19S9-11]MCF6811416.1 LpxL/LpxP family Kdo(2)-lipid IV(A) lauroyl/palmitoleoyl acyltransferase [Thiotrichales bacterium 19S9-12]